MASEYREIDVKEIEVHPDYMLRLDYDIDSLKEEIRREGQLQPGRVIWDKTKRNYLLYIGVRKFLTVKQLYEKIGEEKFKYYKALVDEGLTREQVDAKALSENRQEARKPLRPLELINFIVKRSGNVPNLSFINEYRLLASSFSPELIVSLMKIEKKTGFYFTKQHLEEIDEISSNNTRIAIASLIVATSAPSTEVERLVRKKKDGALEIRGSKK